MKQSFCTVLLAACLVFPMPVLAAQEATEAGDPGQVVGEFLLLLLGSDEGKREALAFVKSHWQPEFTPMMIETLLFNKDAAFGADIVHVLQQKTHQSFGFNLDQWQHWLWNRPPRMHPMYAEYKSALYGLIDDKFEQYFAADRRADIRLDEVLWGGVGQDGIPPLRHPQMIAAADARYLADEDRIFGVSINGDTRAYPQRILAWHEMFTDTVGGVPLAGVYCTLCGTMIVYRTEVNGVNHELGTSGFLYRSNKLMYDRATQSLWNTTWGKPVIGPLAGKGIVLASMPVVTTTWGEWRRRHPQSQVLSLATGYNRDYSEGAAYRDYFATDELMFGVPVVDRRLRNKDEVLALVLPRYPEQPLAIAAKYLARHPVYQDRIGDRRLVVFTDASGANRVYEGGAVNFTRWDGDATAFDTEGTAWQLREEQLRADDGRVLYRLPARRAFWFGWYSAYSNTRLVQ